MTTTPSTGRKRNGLWITGAVLALIGIVVGTAMLGWIMVTSGSLLADNSFTYPGRTIEQLDASTEYAIYTNSFGSPLAPTDVTVKGPDGRDVEVEPAPSAQRNVDINTGNGSYTASVVFRTSVAGSHEVAVGGTARGEAKVAPSVDAMTAPLLGALVGIVIAGLVFVIGMILFIAGLVRRSRAARPAYVPGVPPAYAWGPTPPDLRPPGPPGPPVLGSPAPPAPAVPPAASPSPVPPASEPPASEPSGGWTMPGAKYEPPARLADPQPDPSSRDGSDAPAPADPPSSSGPGAPPPDPWQKARERGG